MVGSEYIESILSLGLKSVKTLSLIILLSTSGCAKSSANITINKSQLNIEIADTPSKRERGLMYRTSLPEDNGILFIHPTSQPLVFWMKNTLIPLSIAFIDEKGRIVSIQDMMPQSQTPLNQYKSPIPVKFALEVPQGWFERHKVVVGDSVKFPASLETAIKKAE